MIMLGLVSNKEIDDDGAASLLDCLKNIKALDLFDCNVSKDMKRNLKLRGKVQGCSL